MIVKCAYCGKDTEKYTGHVNRARKMGLNVYCDRKCSGLGRRDERTEEEKKRAKAEYDKKYLARNFEKRKRQAQEYNASPAGRAMQKRNREKFKESHLEYCRTEKYKQWKKQYDKQHLAKKKYGEFWESAIILNEIDTIIQPEKYNIRLEKGTFNKSQKRKRLWNSLQKI